MTLMCQCSDNWPDLEINLSVEDPPTVHGLFKYPCIYSSTGDLPLSNRRSSPLVNLRTEQYDDEILGVEGHE